MIDTIEAIRTLMKQISGTMANAGLEAKEVPGSKDHASIDTSDSSLTSVNYEGSAGTARLEFSGSTMKILAAKSGENEFHELSETLFENQNEDWGRKTFALPAMRLLTALPPSSGQTPSMRPSTNRRRRAAALLRPERKRRMPRQKRM